MQIKEYLFKKQVKCIVFYVKIRIKLRSELNKGKINYVVWFSPGKLMSLCAFILSIRSE